MPRSLGRPPLDEAVLLPRQLRWSPSVTANKKKLLTHQLYEDWWDEQFEPDVTSGSQHYRQNLNMPDIASDIDNLLIETCRREKDAEEDEVQNTWKRVRNTWVWSNYQVIHRALRGSLPVKWLKQDKRVTM